MKKTTRKFYVEWQPRGHRPRIWARTYYPKKTLAAAVAESKEDCFNGMPRRIVEVVEKFHKV